MTATAADSQDAKDALQLINHVNCAVAESTESKDPIVLEREHNALTVNALKLDSVKYEQTITSGDADFKDNAMVNRLTKSVRSVFFGTKREHAQKVLDIMTNQMPPILKACPRVGKILKVK